MKRIEVFISGAGIAGLTLACYLAKSGIYTAIIDPNLSTKIDMPQHGTRTAAIMSSLLPIFDKIGILEEIKSYSAPLKKLKIIDTPSTHFSKPLTKTFDASEIDQREFSWNIPNNLLLHSLREQANRLENLTLIPQDQIEAFNINDTGVQIKTSSGNDYIASLLVGADGRNSFVRKQANIDTKTKNLEQTAITTILSHTEPHEFTSTEIHKNGGPFTLVPLPNNRSSLVWIETTKDAEQILKLGKNEITQKIQELSNDTLGQIELKDQIQSFPLMSLKSNSIIAKRVALIAEAAHIVPPTGAQGLNLSLRDIKSLHDSLTKAKSLGSDLGSQATLEIYKKDRETDINLRTKSTNILNHFVREGGHIHHTIRRGLFSALSDIEPLRTKIMNKGFK